MKHAHSEISETTTVAKRLRGGGGELAMISTNYFDYSKMLKKIQAISSSKEILCRIAKDQVGDVDPDEFSKLLKDEYLKTLDTIHNKIKDELSFEIPRFNLFGQGNWHSSFSDKFDPIDILESTVEDFVCARAISKIEDEKDDEETSQQCV